MSLSYCFAGMKVVELYINRSIKFLLYCMSSFKMRSKLMDHFDIEMKSDRLLGLSIACPECGSAMQSTGKMYYSPVIKEWLIEYWCPSDRQMFNIYTPETYSLSRELAQNSKSK